MNDKEAGLAEALSQTGFPFEHRIFQQATAEGWTAIPNRLYVDPEEEKTREMDLLCYKAGRGDEAMVFTALLISCKARSEKPWVLMTRPWPRQRPSWYPYPPVPTWTNSIALQHEVGLPGWALEYFNQAAVTGLGEWAEDSREEVFALQEFEARESKGKPVVPPRFKAIGDTSLYIGTMGLLKALSYEMARLAPRRSNQSDLVLYQFNLVQMLDGELYEASFASGDAQVRQIHRYRHFARTMLNGKELSARIDFCTHEAVPALLKDMEALHRFNVDYFNEKQAQFYEGLLIDPTRLAAVAPMIERRLNSVVPPLMAGGPKPDPGWLTLAYKEDAMVLELDTFQVDEHKAMNDSLFMAIAESSLKTICRYSGPFIVRGDIPY